MCRRHLCVRKEKFGSWFCVQLIGIKITTFSFLFGSDIDVKYCHTNLAKEWKPLVCAWINNNEKRLIQRFKSNHRIRWLFVIYPNIFELVCIIYFNFPVIHQFQRCRIEIAVVSVWLNPSLSIALSHCVVQNAKTNVNSCSICCQLKALIPQSTCEICVQNVCECVHLARINWNVFGGSRLKRRKPCNCLLFWKIHCKHLCALCAYCFKLAQRYRNIIIDASLRKTIIYISLPTDLFAQTYNYTYWDFRIFGCLAINLYTAD